MSDGRKRKRVGDTQDTATAEASAPTPTGLIKINVGGTVFTTTLRTLTNTEGGHGVGGRGDHMLAKMFGGEVEPSHIMDEQGNVFIDRDGKHFGTLLNYLRDGRIALPSCSQQLGELRMEAEFFSLLGLVELIDAQVLEVAEHEKQPAPALSRGVLLAGSAPDPHSRRAGYRAGSLGLLFKALYDLQSTAEERMEQFHEFGNSDDHDLKTSVGLWQVSSAWGGVLAATLQGQGELLQYVTPDGVPGVEVDLEEAAEGEGEEGTEEEEEEE